jgi:hypothetical protein
MSPAAACSRAHHERFALFPVVVAGFMTSMMTMIAAEFTETSEECGGKWGTAANGVETYCTAPNSKGPV